MTRHETAKPPERTRLGAVDRMLFASLAVAACATLGGLVYFAIASTTVAAP